MSDNVKVTRSNTYQRKLANLDAGARTGLHKGGVFLVSRVRRVFQMFAPRGHASGQLIRSLTVSPVIRINKTYRCRIGPRVDYGWWVHQGRRPGKWPPQDKILEWIREKGLVPKIMPAGKGSRNRSGKIIKVIRRKKSDVEREQRALAFLIARKIGTKGIDPFPFMTSAYKVSKAEIRAIVVAELVRSLRT